MSAEEKRPYAENVGAVTAEVADDGDGDGAPPITKDSEVGVDNGGEEGNRSSADGENSSSVAAGVKNDESQSPDNVAAAIASPIDYSNLDETPYEHNFEPGDHIIRWDMLPILWPIQIHGIVLEVSEDKSEVTICDFGITSVKNTDDGEEIPQSQDEKNVEEENEKFNEAIQDESRDEMSQSTEDASVKTDDQSDSKGSSTNKKTKQKKQRLTVIKLTKWSDLRKWHKVNYEGGLLNAANKGGVGKGLKNLGEKTGKLWTSMTKSFARSNGDNEKPKDGKKAWRNVRYDVDENGYCVHHPEIQLKRLNDGGDWVTVRKKCPECIKEDCPAMMGQAESPEPKDSLSDSATSLSSTEDELSMSHGKASTIEESNNSNENESGEQLPLLTGNKSSESNGPTTRLDSEEASAEDKADSAGAESGKIDGEPKTLAQMVSDANEIDRQSRTNTVKVNSPSRENIGEKQNTWRGSFMKSMKSLSNIFPSKSNEQDASNGGNSDDDKEDESQSNENEQDTADAEDESNSSEDLPRSDPPILVLARTRFILEHGENVLPPYHIINSNSECIAVWCKTGRWGTLQASVFLHSTAIGHAKSATALTLGVAATNPWLIPAFATVGVAAVGTPWLFLKVANDKWKEATMTLTEKFWMQAEPEVFVECIEKWGKIK
eukprot:CAMPEP_0183715834 /NCGR_PEP_ID=MMETSP0737-20130205/9926_1 /TAXON_ID=385413 /ORGANISM="Thalassiosira miniscula, Strain CCMP1093" /LENGTH=661 /DNA_ID=CAMNT_0025944995 /DNA_START=100 /DNA_END=2085 /DNA_ORIENTATION=-